MLSQTASIPAQSAADAWRSAIRAARDQDFKLAVATADVAIGAGLTDSLMFYYRGRWNFRIGRIRDSLRDFDRFVQSNPDRSNAQWERGITCYYAGRYPAGAKQFEDYQAYHDNDVENAVWRYLCQSKVEGKEKARRSILPIRNDPRVPMMQIYRLFQAQATPAQVLEVLGTSTATGDQAKRETFDAHLYLALYYDSEDDPERAAKHIDRAVKQFKKGDYMWAVAVQHQKHLRGKQQRSP